MIVSIDIGTSYSCISALGPDGKAHPVEIGTGASMFGSKFSLPSAVFAEENGEILVGQAAFNQRKLAPARFQMEFKRHLGESVPIVLGNRSFLPEQLYTELIRHMKTQAEKTGDPISCAYMTFPASYGKSKKDKLLGAARAAGLFDVQLVAEPAAAAMSYCAAGYVQDGQTLLTYDFGGGTFDAALLRYEGGVFQLLTEPLGLSDCGGVDMDRVIFQDMVSMVGPEVMATLMKNPVNMMRFSSQLGELAVKAKHHLSFAEDFQEYIPVGFDVVPYALSREKFNGMIASLVADTVDICRKMVEQAGLKMSDLSSVLMVGGTSRVPLVQQMVQQMAGDLPVYSATDLDLAVAQGALNYRMMESRQEEKAPAPESAPEPEPEKAAPPEAEIPAKPEKKPKKKEKQKKEEPDAAQMEEMMQAAENWLRGPMKAPLKAVGLYEQAADQGYAPAQYLLGSLYLEGSLVPQDLQKGTALIRQAAEQGIPEAQYVLGTCYLQGCGIRKNRVQGCKWLEKAVQQGNPEAVLSLAACYAEGEGVAKDLNHAIDLYESAAAAGENETVDLNLGLCYLERKADDRDLAMAVDLLYRAAEKDNALAMYTLGQCCEKGLGVEENKEQAKAWIRAAADRGNADAQVDLAMTFRLGGSRNADRCLWFYWMQQAIEDEGPAGKYARDLIGDLPRSEYESLSQQMQILCRDAAAAADNWAEYICDLVDECMAVTGVDLSNKRFNHPKVELQRSLMEVPGGDKTIFSLDTSTWLSAKSGTVITNQGIYNKISWQDVQFTSWQELAQVGIYSGLCAGQIRLNDNRTVMDVNGTGNEQALMKALERVSERLHRLYQYNSYLIQERNDRK